jgi:superfamily I DNA and/or RNA helicase
MPALHEILKPTVVVATLTKAGSLHNAGVARGHFEMIVVDEGGQAFEAEAMAPLGCLLGADGQLVIGGDPKQLGPIVHHSLAKEHGLGVSYLERLMERSIYQKDLDAFSSARGAYDHRVLTKLVRNYRSHALLLELPNRLFYDGDLLSCVDPMIGEWCIKWEGLETPFVPLLWHGIVGKDQRDGSSPSWFNNDECVQVVAHVKDLLAPGRHNRLTPADIGVITPYNKQVHRLNLALRSQQLGDVKVGSTPWGATLRHVGPHPQTPRGTPPSDILWDPSPTPPSRCTAPTCRWGAPRCSKGKSGR